ncbi:MAG: uroporphyrinogen-III synthase [Acidobacteriota bacterium]
MPTSEDGILINQAEMPLAGRRILITRARRSSDELSVRLQEWGAEVICCPTIEIVAPTSFQPLDKAIEKLANYDWIIFTSKNAVEVFLDRLTKLGQDRQLLAKCKILAVGATTAHSLTAAGVTVTLLPKQYCAEGALASLQDYYSDNKKLRACRFLFPRAAQGREVLVTELQRLGAQIDLVEAYRTQTPADAYDTLGKIFAHQSLDVITFTSPSTIHNLAEILTPQPLSVLLANSIVACIGPVTAAAAREYGLTVSICPTESSAAMLALAVREHFEKSANNH